MQPSRRSPASLALRAVALLAAAAAAADAQTTLGSGAGAGTPAGARADCRQRADSGAGICRTDVETYVGWRVFIEHCAGCHAMDALGSDFAPSLVHRIRRFDRRGFYAALDEGYLGGNSDLGPWGDDPDVARYYDELWTYLTGRAAGTVPPGALEPVR